MSHLNLKVLPFKVPGYVLTEGSSAMMSSGPAFPLECLDALALSAMCDEFRAEVFKKAGKIDPFQCETQRAKP